MTFWYFKCLNTSYLHSVPMLSCNFTWQGKFWLFLYDQNIQWELPTSAAQIYGLIPVRESVNKRGSVCACMYKSNEKPRLLFHYWEWKHQREGCCVHSRRAVNANWLIYLCYLFICQCGGSAGRSWWIKSTDGVIFIKCVWACICVLVGFYPDCSLSAP